jgi:hypothetical protein
MVSFSNFDVPPVFNRFAFFVDQDSWACRTIDDMAKHGLRGVKSKDVEEFARFVQTLGTMSASEFNAEKFWNESPSAVFFVGHDYVLSFLKRAAEIALTEGTDFDEEGDAENIRYVKREV